MKIILTPRGFSLVELLVVLGLFSGIATLTLGSLFNAQAVNARILENQSALDNINLSLSIMIRDIRLGSQFNCMTGYATTTSSISTERNNCSRGGDSILFKSVEFPNDRDRVVYYLEKGIIYKSIYPFGGTATVGVQLTTDEVTIDSLVFYVDGAHTTDGSNDVGNVYDFKQPLVTLFISGHANKTRAAAAAPITFSIQTTISSRDFDNR